MKSITKLLLIGVAAVALFYVPVIMALKQLTCTLTSFTPTAINTTSIDAVVGIKVKNPTGTQLQIQSINADVLFNGVDIAQFAHIQPFQIMANAEQLFNLAITIDASTLGQSIWAELITANLQNSILKLSGTITANGRILPFTTDFTINDITL